jgi:hypothetical protein
MKRMYGESLSEFMANNPEFFSAHLVPTTATQNPLDRPQGHPRFYELLDEMRKTHDSKNSDYADSSVDPLRNFRACEDAGIPAFEGCITRLSDKYMRVMNLARKEREGREVGVKSEAITDTLLDLANYALIALILYEEAHDGE